MTVIQKEKRLSGLNARLVLFQKHAGENAFYDGEIKKLKEEINKLSVKDKQKKEA